MHLKNSILAGVAILTIASCNQPATKTAETSSRKFIDRANMDTTVHPGDNFFQYANAKTLDGSFFVRWVQ